MKIKANRKGAAPSTTKTSGQLAIRGNEIRGGSFSKAPRSGLSPSKKRVIEPARETRKTALNTSMNLTTSTINKENNTDSVVPKNRASITSTVALRQSTTSATSTATSLTSYVERKSRYIAQSSDLYHIVQVHLGFIDKYMLVPARGKIVPSKARPWLTISDIKEAFLAARQSFSEAHVYALMKLVVAFAKKSKPK